MSVDLSALRRFIRERPGASARELALHFRLSAGLAEAMLERLALRGDIERLPQAEGAACACSGCTGCSSGCGCGHGEADSSPRYRLAS